MDFSRLVPISIEAASFVAAFAAIAASIIMVRYIRKFVTGILAKGFRTIALGIFLLSMGILIDVIEQYSSLSILLIVRQIFFVVGAYVIVIGCKRMGDKLEILSKHGSA